MYNRITVYQAKQESIKQEKEKKEQLDLIDKRIRDNMPYAASNGQDSSIVWLVLIIAIAIVAIKLL